MLGEDASSQPGRVPCEKEGEKLGERCALHFGAVARKNRLAAFGESESAPRLGRAAVFHELAPLEGAHALAQLLRGDKLLGKLGSFR